MPMSKKYKAASALFDRDALFTPTEAVELVKKTASAKFDESVDVAIRLGVDPRKPDQAVRGTVALPSGSGKTMRIAVFTAAGLAAAGLPLDWTDLQPSAVALDKAGRAMKELVDWWAVRVGVRP